MKLTDILRLILAIVLMLPILVMIVLTILSFFGVDDGGYVTRFSSWFFAGILASAGAKLMPDLDEQDEEHP